MELSTEVKSNIREFLVANWSDFQKDAKEYGGLDITFATNDDGDAWNYQTGDNSFTGGCYGLPHWAVETIEGHDGTPLELSSDIINQLEELLPENR
jgi:hypothetical protein